MEAASTAVHMLNSPQYFALLSHCQLPIVEFHYNYIN